MFLILSLICLPHDIGLDAAAMASDLMTWSVWGGRSSAVALADAAEDSSGAERCAWELAKNS